MHKKPMTEQAVIARPIDDLKPYANNPRTHSKRQIEQIAESIKAFGWTNPVLIDDAGGVIAGHGRIEAAKLLGLDAVPTLCLSAMSEAQKRAYIIADNKLAENAGWDDEILAIELQGLLELDLDFDISVIGFETAEIDLLVGSAETAAEDDPADACPEPEPGPPVAQIGDLWRLGAHRLFCGDALEASSYAAVLDGESAQCVFTDPPYNVPINGHVSGKGAVKHDEFVMAAGEMSADEFQAFLDTACAQIAQHMAGGAIAFICIDWRHVYELIAAGRESFSALKNICVWSKTNGGMGSLYRSQHELICVFKNGAAPHINNVALGKFGRNRTNVWTYAGANAFSVTRAADLAAHPTVKPVAMIADALLDVTNRGGLVLDPFAGSGATLMAAENTGRRAAAIELDPKYVDVAIRRFEAATGEKAVHGETRKTFAEVKTVRAIVR